MANQVEDNVLVGRYELGQRLGVGGMAEVFHGKDRVLGRTVAVKMLLPQFSHDPSFIARFRREATSAASLNHPNIVGVYDSGSDESRHFIVMEYIDGRTLKDVIREEGPLLPERAAEIAAEVCSALQFAHAHGIVHRDVKPANIMINSRGEVKVADFGIARAASGESVTQTATVLGTAQYFSPEQAQAAPVDARSDLYSLGVVMYEMMTRQVPFSGSSPVAIAYKHVKEDPIPPTRLNADIPASIEAVIMRSLSKNPDNRYQSAQEMRQDIERAVRGLPVDAPRVMSPSEQTAVMSAQPIAGDDTVMLRRPTTSVTRTRRRPLGIGLLIAIAIAMIAIIVWALISLLPKTPATVPIGLVSGLKVSDAQAKLKSEGFTVVVATTKEPSPTVPDGYVIRTDPPEGTAVPKNSKVTIIASAGKAKVKVPSVKGMTESAALQKLQQFGLNGTVVTASSTSVRSGDVISQTPQPNTSVDSGSTVTLTVSSGPETAILPNEVGKTQADATNDLNQRGFVVNVVAQSPTPTCQAGYVCKQTPQGNSTPQPRGSNVDIFVAQNPSPSPSPSPSTSQSI